MESLRKQKKFGYSGAEDKNKMRFVLASSKLFSNLAIFILIGDMYGFS